MGINATKNIEKCSIDNSIEGLIQALQNLSRPY